MVTPVQVQPVAPVASRAPHATGRDRPAGGPEAALRGCYVQLGPMVLGYLRRLVGPAEAEDVLQHTFIEVWRSWDRYDPERSIEAWVLAIARRRAIDALRRRRTVLPLDAVGDVAGEDGRQLADRYARAAQVRAALLRLPAEQREVLTLGYFADCPQAEIADRLGVPLGTVKARTFRGLRRLAELLAGDEQTAQARP